MGFFNKLWNFVRGKGWQEQQQEEEIKQTPDKEYVREQQYPEKQQEQIDNNQEEQQKQPQIKHTIHPKQEQTPEEQEIKKFKENLSRQPLKKDIEAKIDREPVNTLNVQTNIQDIGELKPLYTKIFTDNAKLTDPDILNVLIQNRRQLQHRFEATFKIYDEKGQVGELRTSGILIEHTAAIYKYINIGQEIDYLQEALDATQSFFEQNYGAIGGSAKSFTNKKVKVTHVDIDVTYA